MIRHPAVYTAPPSSNLIPFAGSGVWYPLHGVLAPGIVDLPEIAEVVTSGSASGSKWTTDGVYTFPDDNGVTNDIALRAVDDEDDLYIDSQMSMVGMVADNHFVTTVQAYYDVDPNATSCLWCYGRASSGTATCIALQISGSEVPTVVLLGKGGTQNSVTLSADSGTFASLRGALFTLVLGMRAVSTSEVDIELRMSDGSTTAVYSASAQSVMQGGATAPPGVSGGVTMANFTGLTLGARANASGVTENWWGRTASNTGKIGGFAARKFTTYSATRVTDTLASMLARPLEFPRTLCRDYT